MLLARPQFFRQLAWAATAFLFAATPSNRCWADDKTESEAKAMYLAWFAEHVLWREDDFPARDSPLVIIILGESPFERKEIDWLKSRTVHKHRIEIRQLSDVESVTVCHILFVCRSEKKNLGKALKPFKERRILTISDIDEFTQEGGMASVVVRQYGVARNVGVPDINKEAATKGGLVFAPDTYAAVKTLQARYR